LRFWDLRKKCCISPRYKLFGAWQLTNGAQIWKKSAQLFGKIQYSFAVSRQLFDWCTKFGEIDPHPHPISTKAKT